MLDEGIIWPIFLIEKSNLFDFTTTTTTLPIYLLEGRLARLFAICEITSLKLLYDFIYKLQMKPIHTCYDIVSNLHKDELFNYEKSIHQPTPHYSTSTSSGSTSSMSYLWFSWIDMWYQFISRKDILLDFKCMISSLEDMFLLIPNTSTITSAESHMNDNLYDLLNSHIYNTSTFSEQDNTNDENVSQGMGWIGSAENIIAEVIYYIINY
jgi:hypothetical protein